ncbi:MAG: hypothetical protein ACOCP8_04840 [archaeon]
MERQVCPICKDRVRKVFEENKDDLSYKKAKVLEKIKKGYEKYKRNIRDYLTEEELKIARELKREIDEKIYPANGFFHTIGGHKEISITKNKIKIDIKVECDTCKTKWKVFENFPNDSNK